MVARRWPHQNVTKLVSRSAPSHINEESRLWPLSKKGTLYDKVERGHFY